MLLRKILMALPLVAMAGTVSAQAFTADNNVIVQPAGANSFAVASGNRYGARGAWCAAADYAQDVLKQRGTARIYVQQPKTRPSGTVVFGLDPAGAAPAAVSSTEAALRVPGANLSIDHAKQFCVDARLFRGQ